MPICCSAATCVPPQGMPHSPPSFSGKQKSTIRLGLCGGNGGTKRQIFKVLLLNLYQDAFAILIENSQVAETLKTIHRIAWGNKR